MPVLGITGGIATGKSSFVRALTPHLGATVFDADAAAHALLESEPSVAAAIRRDFGPEALDENGRPDRRKLREIVFAQPEARRRLEGILHPVIRAGWIASAGQYAARAEWLLIDIPLLYETDAQQHLERVVVVACSRATQLARLRQNRKLDDPLIQDIIGAQLDLGMKIRQASHVVWNDSTPACLDEQARLLAGYLRTLYV